MYPDYAVLVFKLLLNSEIWKVDFRHGLPLLRLGDFLGLTSHHSCDRDRHLAIGFSNPGSTDILY